MRETDLAYLAGLLDADGCISLRQGRRRYYTMPQISVASTTPELTDWCQATFGGATAHSRHPLTSNHYLVQWALSGEAALALVPKLRAFLVLKKPQAALLEEYAASYEPTPRIFARSVSDEQQAIRVGFLLAMRFLNHHGRS